MTALTVAQRRQLDQLQPAVDRVTEADAAFFERFPARAHRVRLASSAELGQNAVVQGQPGKAPEPGCRWFVAVRQLVPGVRLRVYFQGLDGADIDLTEEAARHLYRQIVTPDSYAARVEAQMASAVAKMGAPK